MGIPIHCCITTIYSIREGSIKDGQSHALWCTRMARDGQKWINGLGDIWRCTMTVLLLRRGMCVGRWSGDHVFVRLGAICRF
jgi:hypothetical protein